MKIALARAKYNPFGGAERFLNAAAAALAANGAAPTILTRDWPTTAPQGGVAIAHRIVDPRHLTKAGRERGFARAVQRIAKSGEFDLVQSYERIPDVDIYHAVDGVHAEWLAQRARVQGRAGRLGVRINPHHRAVLELEAGMYASRRLRAVICISELVKRNVVERYGVVPERCHVIYGDIDSEKFHPGLKAEHRARVRAELGLPAAAPVVVFVGSGFVRKGVEGFLRTLAKVPDAHGIVVGHDKALARFRRLAAALGLGRRVVFTGGAGDVRPFYGAADAYLMPTLYEPFGLAYGEAMACALPVIVSTRAGAADWIAHGVNGFVADPLDIDAMVQALRAALADPSIGARARQSVLPFTAQATAAKYLALYRELLG